jgi:predicted DNA-binding transcriptional regulator AlpA
MPRKKTKTVSTAETAEAAPARLRDIAYITSRWGCSRATVYRAIKDGSLRIVKVRGLTRATDEAITAAEVAQ